MTYKTATLTRPQHCGAGFVHGEQDEPIPASKFVGRMGNVIMCHDTGYDTDRPDGSEPILYLVDFDGERVWIEHEALTLH